ncbi:MAG: restriction endonuclease subunit S [Acidobacteriota bacterium]
MTKQKKFKQTEIGEIPKEWEVVRLGKILTLEYGKGLSERERKAGMYPVVGSNGIVGYHEEALVKGPGIVIGRKGTIGAVSWINSDFWPIDTTYYINTLIKDIELKWLFFVLNHLNLPKLSLADVVPGLKRELVHVLKLPLPPLPEQKKIAKILSTVDEAIEKVDETIEKTERLKKGLMHELLTKGIGYKEFKETEIGRIPKEWEVVRLGKILTLEYGKGLSERERKAGMYPVVGSNGIVGYHEEALVKGPGIVIGRKGTIGAVSWINSDFWPIDTTYYINTLIKDIELKWLFFVLNHLNLPKLSLADVVPGLKRELVHVLKLPLPPLPEQKKIAEILSTGDRRLEMLKEKKGKFERIKKGLMNDLLTGRKRVKLET